MSSIVLCRTIQLQYTSMLYTTVRVRVRVSVGVSVGVSVRNATFAPNKGSTEISSQN